MGGSRKEEYPVRPNFLALMWLASSASTDAAVPARDAGAALQGAVETYMQAFNKRQFLRVASCFADSYFQEKGIQGADFVADMERRYYEDGYWAVGLLRADAKVSNDGQSANGHFLYQLTGHHRTTTRAGRRGHDMRHEFSRTDFEARKGLTGWQFTKFETQPSQEAAVLKMGKTLKMIQDYLARPDLTEGERARKLADLSFFYIQYDVWPKAEEAARQSIQVEPTWLGHSCLARALKEQAKYDDAIEHYRGAALMPDCNTPGSYTRRHIRECKILKEKALGK